MGNEEITQETQLDGPIGTEGRRGAERSVKQDRLETIKHNVNAGWMNQPGQGVILQQMQG